jgi:hypothetical protein
VLRRLVELEVPDDVRDTLERIRAQANDGLRGFADRSRVLDASLPQLVESARGKVDYQYARLLDGLVGKSRHKLERRRPEWTHLRGYLLPGDRPWSGGSHPSMWPIVEPKSLEIGAPGVRSARTARGEHAHLILEL